ncbi:Gfo/Idh/MocA family oxidoreductase [Arthrobacter sp. AK01]|uniref:Gfo/Idh/MocA family protein n=1 Tax=Micrococcaceae TaxID=1268 RepID=UPI001E3EC4D1|nr:MULTISPECIES: Gfo/Idh/MocA family oxidoreductase [Micrococcaceae]MCD4852946.1 Gfo/Idh/MocA family oxidoreductase [Arthrobacter sp. AK01]MCP1412183.1 putative dehydrogenase [Paenarthrobacter sp. A20]
MTTAAIIGCGDISTVHFSAISTLAGVQLAAVCDTDPGRLEAASAAHGVPGYADYLDMLQEVRPDVVHVCTPHHLHASVAADCLERGVNVIVEKPLAHTLAEGKRLIEAAERSPAKIAVCFQNRYNATSQAMRKLLDDGGLGQVIGASATVMWHRDGDYYRSRPWRGTWAEGGGGLMMNQAIHTVDLLQWLVGDVAKVEGRASTRSLGGVIEVEDTAEFVAEHVGGARSVFYATLANAVNAPVTLDIVTEKATLSLRGDLTVTYADGRVDVIPERVVESGGRSYWGVSHELLIADFYSRLAEPGPFWINPAEAGKSLGIIKDIYAQSYPEMPGRVG